MVPPALELFVAMMARRRLERIPPQPQFAPDILRLDHADVARRVGRAPVGPDDAELAALRTASLRQVAAWTVDELARATLLLEAGVGAPPDAFAALIAQIFRGGDARERQAIVRTLALLPAPERFLAIGLAAAEGAAAPLFEAIAIGNPYPAERFPAVPWARLVLRAIFAGIPIERIDGLATRVTPELRRLCTDHVTAERRRGRKVPPDAERLAAWPGAAAG